VVSVERDAAPQHLHGRGVCAQSLAMQDRPKLEHLAGKSISLDVELRRRIEAAGFSRRPRIRR